MPEFKIFLDYDADDEPPREFICGPSGKTCVEVIEEPAWVGDEAGDWFDDNNWEVGPLATKITDMLNEELKDEDQ